MISQEKLQQAARAGAELLASDEVRVPSSRMGDLIVLRELLTAVATGQLVVARPPQEQGAGEPQKQASTEPEEPAAKPRRAKAKK